MREVKTNEEFHDAIQEGKVVVKFYADWCPDCHRIDPFMPELEEQYQKDFTLIQINKDVVPDVFESFDVFGIPSFIAFKDGKEVIRFVSKLGKTREEIEKFFDRFVQVAKEI